MSDISESVRARLIAGNRRYLQTSDAIRRINTAENGQHPYAIVICCSDARVIPEEIFSATLGDLFVIRVAGNVLDKHQLGSIEYASMHLHCGHIIVLGHTGCGAVAAALGGGGEGFIQYVTDDILKAIKDERDPDEACRINVRHAVARLKREFQHHPEVGKAEIEGAIYDIRSGEVQWIV